jgi:hypothetical protein
MVVILGVVVILAGVCFCGAGLWKFYLDFLIQPVGEGVEGSSRSETPPPEPEGIAAIIDAATGF